MFILYGTSRKETTFWTKQQKIKRNDSVLIPGIILRIFLKVLYCFLAYLLFSLGDGKAGVHQKNIKNSNK